MIVLSKRGRISLKQKEAYSSGMQASGQLTQPLVLKSIPKVGKAVSKNTFKNKLKSKKTHQHQNNNKKPNQHQKTLPAPKLTSIWFFFFCSLFFNVCFTVEKLLQTTGLKILVNSWGWHVLNFLIKLNGKRSYSPNFYASEFDQRKRTSILAVSSAFDSSNVLCVWKVGTFP